MGSIKTSTAVRPSGLSTAPSVGATELERPCPACGNSSIQECRVWYTLPEFEVLRCCQCGVIFINRVVDDNVGFTVECAIITDPTVTLKSAHDFKSLKENLQKIAGVAQSRSVRLLDVGCGIGTFLLEARQEGWRVAGLELSPTVGAYAREQRGLEVHVGSIESVTDFPQASFDIISMFGVIEHLANPSAAAQECAKILRPGGFLVLQTPTEDGLLRRAGRFLYWATGGLVKFQASQLYQMAGGHSICFDRRSIKVLLSRYNFEVLSIEQSTYGVRALLLRFASLPLHKKLPYVVGTCILFWLGRIVGGTNHMTVYARRSATGSAGFHSP
jgi:2-polyprenyl-3-methyl-5-hydroxy-6-metoxy-1,4-benzoquinol methylase